MASPGERAVEELKNTSNRRTDIMEVIKKHCLKLKPPEKHDILKPTIGNLFALDQRFKEQVKRKAAL